MQNLPLKVLKLARAMALGWAALSCEADDSIRWHPAPIYGGGYFQNVITCPSATNVWYCYVDVGGPYRSDDAGTTWRPLHSNFSASDRHFQADHVRTMSVDPRDADSFVLCSGNNAAAPAGVYVSTDGGRTFRDAPELKRFWRIAFDGAVKDLAVASSGDGFYVSYDGARTFEKIPDSLRVPSGARRDVYVGGGRIFLMTTGSGLWMADLSDRKRL